jgi:predicted transcriptional regulator YdeE
MNHAPVNFAPVHYLFVEKVGPFMETAMKSWKELHSTLPNPPNKTGAMALYRFKPEMTYRAGFVLSQKPSEIPPGFKYENFEGGRYEKFTVTGSYSQLPKASGDVWETAKTLNLREGWAIENYANDPATTPEDKLVTEIMVPVK